MTMSGQETLYSYLGLGPALQCETLSLQIWTELCEAMRNMLSYKL